MNMQIERPIIKDVVIPISKVDNVRRIKKLNALNILTVIWNVPDQNYFSGILWVLFMERIDKFFHWEICNRHLWQSELAYESPCSLMLFSNAWYERQRFFLQQIRGRPKLGPKG